MNPKLFLGDFAFLLFFVSQGIETHNSEASFLEILLPFVISMIIIWPLFYKIGFLKIDENPEYIKSLRVHGRKQLPFYYAIGPRNKYVLLDIMLIYICYFGSPGNMCI